MLGSLTKSKSMEVIGIDVSKSSFDAWSKSLGHKSFKNEKKGFASLLSWGGAQVHYVMESTCSYHLQLAIYLFENEGKVSVVNPLPVKRYMQMKLQRLKTDKSDARMLSLYGAAEQPKLWKPEASYIQECKLMMSTVELYLRQ